jgi:uncharacterized protein YdeI (YjbR/CyaY-like superfamily)
MIEPNPKVDAFLDRENRWPAEMAELRRIVLSCGLDEDLKWGQPCYSMDGKNIVLIHGFKDYCACLFFKGALLKDPEGILVVQTENVQSGRQVRFTGVRGIVERQAVLKAYIEEAMEVEKAGLKVAFKKTTEFVVPEEFQAMLDGSPALRKAFESLTPGRQRAYLLHFASAKQARTRDARIEKHLPRILVGKGLDD